MNKVYTFFCCCLLLAMGGVKAQALPGLKVSANHRYLLTADGDPFFWLGDTGWLLFSKLTREEAVQYLEDRKAKGFNVIQAMVLHTVKAKNVYGDSALVGKNVARPLIKKEHDYWQHVDYIVKAAESRGIYVAMVPVWGSDVKGGLVNSKQAKTYATFLANRYKGFSNIIWMNGGDIKGSDSIQVWNTIGSTLYQLDKNHLVTFHPRGRYSSSAWFHNQSWLSFNVFQSGHRDYSQDTSRGEWHYGEDNWKYVQRDFKLQPAKPSFDAEPIYENIPHGLHDTLAAKWNAGDVRRYGYWSVFAGGCGYTYGNNAVMQMRKADETETGAYGARDYWFDAINNPGASQMIHIKQLLLSRPYLERVPDATLIAEGTQGERYNYLAATRGKKYAFVYTYTGRNITIAPGKIQGNTIKAQWYNPRNGEYIAIETYANTATKTFDPPGEPAAGNDWVLVLDSTD
ncbi:Putative collagen-binding domain of a collagenase [Filimonas lacunae]|uniref:Putative collagen-binding domain of a collagenase n=1 Tax=Filimonas lacunae TaxID=477680 RepID=A0A173MCF8_9BACT|nr:glycoside hydrolase family 140 protein [Filimonas lacunae]BAV05169.1 hypothetical protein FLA_1176 [Filimonas lacunae]SIT22823.1 Putative collagen-binding domain of a collagenase [Filimonas lacunae]